MKVLIVGTGTIGAIYGWAASQAGQEVVHLVRPGRSARYTHGIEMDIYDCRARRPRRLHSIYPVQICENLPVADPFDLVVVPTKHFSLTQTLQEIAPVTRQTDTLLLTQNWHGVAALEPYLQADHFCFGDAKAGGSFGNDRLVCTLKALDFGPVQGQAQACRQKCQGVFAGAVPVHYHENMLHYLWVQYAITGGMWPAIVRAGQFKRLFSDGPGLITALLAVQECLQVVQARGVRLEDFPETQLYLHPTWLTRLALPTIVSFTLAHSEYRKRCSLHALADPQEVHAFYFDLVDSGRALGIAMPVMESYRPDILNFTQPRAAW